MIRAFIPLTITCLLSVGAATPEKLPVLFSPVTIDGKVTANGTATINGHTYVSLDALRAQGVTALNPTTLMIYRAPGTTGRPILLHGCINEFLFNGADRLKVAAPVWDDSQKLWNVPLVLQTSSDGFPFYKFAYEQVIAVYKSGRTFSPANDPIQKADLPGLMLEPGINIPLMLSLQDPNDDGSDPLVKLMLPPSTVDSHAGKGVMNFDLTCQK